MKNKETISSHPADSIMFKGKKYTLYNGQYNGISRIKSGKHVFGPDVFIYEDGRQKPIYTASDSIDTTFVVYDEITGEYTKGYTTNILWKKAFTARNRFPQIDINKIGI